MDKYPIGALVGRFQIHELHEAHHYVIKQVVDNHKKVILFLGVSKVLGTKKNPLDFETRKKMIQDQYPDIVILALPDQSNDFDWSKELDKRVREVYHIGDVLLYGGRDSFLPHYHGSFNTKELEQYTFVSGTEVRKRISEETKNSSDFRAGVIYNSYNQYKKVYPTISILAFDDKKEKVLLCKIPGDPGFRPIDGFVYPKDSSLEMAAKRIFIKKTSTEIDDLKYRFSMKLDDWRYRGEEDKIMTSVFSGKFLFGIIQPSEDLLELRWISTSDITHSWISQNASSEFKILFNEFKKIL